MAQKETIACPNCKTALTFREWSRRYAKGSRWREALALCESGCGKWAVRYFDGARTCEPYQVRAKGRKTKTCTARTNPERYAAIIALWGSFQAFVDQVNVLPCVTQQYKT